MLKVMRDQFRHLKFVLWFVVAVFLLLVFVDWGTGRNRGGGASAAIRVGDLTMDETQFLRKVRQTEDRFRQLYGDQWEQLRGRVNVAEQTAAQIIQQELLTEEARKAGLTVTKKELQEKILAIPTFTREDGSFVGADLYARILRANGMTPEQFEEDLKAEILTEKLRGLLEDGIVVTDREVEEQLRKERESASFDAIFVRTDQLLAKVSVSDDEVRSYYESHQDAFRRDEQRVIRYLQVETARLRRLLPVDDAEIESYYNEHRDEFRQGEQARARHILIKVAPDAPAAEQAKAKLKAEAVAKMARSGADFAELARKHSEDAGTRDNGGDLGWFGRGRMVKEFEDAVFGHKPGEIVGPVRSQFGFHIIKVEGFRPARIRPLDEVKEQVRFKLLEGRAAGEAEARARALAERIRKEKPATDEAWQAIADEDESVILNISPPFGKEEVIPGIGKDEELTNAVFDAESGDIGGPRATPRGWIVWQLVKVIPAGVPPLEEVRAEVEAQLRREKALELARSTAQSIAQAWTSGADGAELAKKAGTSVLTANEHRRGTPVPGVGLAPELDAAVFSASVGAVVGPVTVGDRGAVVARITGLKTLSAEEIAKEREAYRKRLKQQRASQLLQSILNERRRQTVITVDEALIKRFAPQESAG
jgi:peptidyl-prolyl cis-trans isomerase D